MARKTKKEWIEWFNSIDDDVEIEINLSYGKVSEGGKLRKITIYGQCEINKNIRGYDKG